MLKLFRDYYQFRLQNAFNFGNEKKKNAHEVGQFMKTYELLFQRMRAYKVQKALFYSDGLESAATKYTFPEYEVTKQSNSIIKIMLLNIYQLHTKLVPHHLPDSQSFHHHIVLHPIKMVHLMTVF